MMPAVMIFLEDLEVFAGAISPEDLGEAVLAIAGYIKDGAEPDGLSPMATACYRLFKAKADKQRQSYESKVAAGKRGGTAKAANVAEAKQNVAEAKQTEVKATNYNVEPKPEPKQELKTITRTEDSGGVQRGDAAAAAPAHTAKRFVPPTLDEAKDYAREKGLKLDVERYMAYYNSNGWMVGRNHMRDWRAAMQNWARNEVDRAPTRPEKALNAQKFDQRDLGEEDLRTSSEDEIYREILKMRERGGADETAGIHSAG